ncbi:MAG: hypothetical protein QQN41_13540 [Nitrosopumilus sp.]
MNRTKNKFYFLLDFGIFCCIILLQREKIFKGGMMIREFIGTIKAKHVGKSFFRAFDESRFLGCGFGRICLCDVGKRVYIADAKFPVMENNEQRDKRLMAKGY